MSFHGNYPIRTQTVLDDNRTKQVAHLKYRGCHVTYEVDQDINQKKNVQAICGTVCRTLNEKTRRD
jgi:hypothetical protein